MSTVCENDFESYYEEIVILPCYVKLTRLTVIEVGPDEDTLEVEKFPKRKGNTAEQTGKQTIQPGKFNQIGGRNKTRNCVFCGKSFAVSGKYLRHLFVHTRERPHFCTFCQASFACKHHLGSHHRKVHLKIVSSPHSYKCKQCEKSFTTRPHLSRHVRVEHKGYRIHCPLCSKSFGYNDKLKMHIKTVHNVEQESLSDILKLTRKTSRIDETELPGHT